MAFTLYDATVANYLQTLGAVSGVLDRSLKYFQENNINADEIPDARLVPDMLPFHFQIASIVQHSKGAVEAVQSGKFSPPKGMPGVNFAGMQAAVNEAHTFMAAMTPDATNALGGKDVNFHLGEHVLPFTAEGFLMSFSLPNFYFHATTAYDLLRIKGVPLGKRNFLGQMRMKAAA